MAEFEKLPLVRTAQRHLNVAAYARVSTAHERQTSSLTTQIEAYQRRIDAEPLWDLVGIFVDDGITGTSLSKRQGLQELMAKVKTGGVDLILTKSISRLARNTVDLLTFVRLCKAHGCDIFFERENIHSSSAEGEIMLSILASFAQEESESASRNVVWAQRKRYEQGIPSSFVAYGYRWTGTEFEIVEDEAYVVRTTFENYLLGISPERTAQELSAQGYRSRCGKPLRGYQLRSFLENERYMGCQLLQKSYVAQVGSNIHPINDGVLPQYWVEDANPAIVSKELFQAVQEEIAKRRERGPMATPSRATSILTGRVQCACCGKNYQRKTKTRKDGTKRRFWSCWSANLGKGACGRRLEEPDLKHLLCEHFELDAFDEEALIHVFDHMEVFLDHILIVDSDGKTTKVER